jgi:uncharacterized membrane protein
MHLKKRREINLKLSVYHGALVVITRSRKFIELRTLSQVIYTASLYQGDPAFMSQPEDRLSHGFCVTPDCPFRSAGIKSNHNP